MRTDDDAPAAAAGAMTAPGDDAKRAERRTSVTFASADVIVEGSDAGGGGGGGDARRPPAGSRRVSVGSGAAASARVSALRDGSFAASDFVNTNRIVLRSDGRGNAYLNQYVVIKDLGQGAFGKVKLCLNTKTNRMCALKCINRKLLRRKYASVVRGGGAAGAPSVAGNDAVKREIAIMKKLIHPNVVRLYEVIDDDVGKYIFLALEYVPGGVVYEPAAYDGGRMSEEVALRYFRETCVGLSFLHANGVAHRDLKPDNLLKKTDGTVKITDFGVSELFDGSKKGNLTGGVGTPAFVAPELVATREAAAAAAAYFEKDLKPILKPSRSGSKPGFETDVAARELATEAEEDSADCDGKGGGVDAKACDVWSLGVCLFYQVCGVVPFPGASAEEVARRVREDSMRVPKGAKLAPSLLDLLEKILDKNPKTRATLSQVMEHPWVTKNGKQPLRVTHDASARNSVTSADVLASIGDVGNASFSVESFFAQKAATARTFKRGEYLVRQGERGSSEMFYIEEGEVEVVTKRRAAGGGGGGGGGGDEKEEEEDKDDHFDDDIMSMAMMNVAEEETPASEERNARDDERENAAGKREEESKKKKKKKSRGGGGGGLGFFSCCLGGKNASPATTREPSDSDPKRRDDDAMTIADDVFDDLRVMRSPHSINALIARRGPGDVIGEMSLLTPGPSAPRSASVRAVSETVKCSVISKESLGEINPELLEELRLGATERESELLLGQTRLKLGNYQAPN